MSQALVVSVAVSVDYALLICNADGQIGSRCYREQVQLAELARDTLVLPWEDTADFLTA